jgi:dihydroorotate dehydrogenase electron transfer subunit
MPIDVAAEVTANRLLSTSYNVLTLEAPTIAAATAPGQFVMVKLGEQHDPLLRRPFSVFEILRTSDGTPSGITLFSKRVGISTDRLYHARRGDRVSCLGPLGRPWPIIEPPAAACLVAGGVGLAAFATLAEALVQRGVSTTLFYGGRTRDDLFYLDFFRALGVDLALTTEDGSLGERGRVTAPLERHLAASGRSAIVYACGPEGMMAAVTTVSARFGCPSHVSLERIMGCGLGGCYSCVVPIRESSGSVHHVRSCIAGPVMGGEQIVWNS